MPASKHKMRWLTVVTITLAVVLVGMYWLFIHRHRQLPVDHVTVSPNGEWRVTQSLISAGEPMLALIRIYDARDVLRGEAVREIEQGGADDLWTCDAQGCSSYLYGLGPRAENIALPPTGWVKARAAIP